MTIQEKDDNRIARAIRKGLKNKKITQVELAEKMGLTKGAVHQWCTGVNTPSAQKLIEVAQYLDIVDELFSGVKKDDEKFVTREEFENLREDVLLLKLLVAKKSSQEIDQHSR